MVELRGYRDLVVWSKSMTLVEEVYRLSTQYPSTEQFGLTSQIRRAVVSIPSNLAEGYGQGGGNYRRHVYIARGSLMEVETQLELSVRLNFCTRESVKTAWGLSQEVGKMLTKLAASLG